MKVFCLDSCLRRNDESGMTFSSESLNVKKEKGRRAADMFCRLGGRTETKQ
jgi:hypothetical protein